MGGLLKRAAPWFLMAISMIFTASGILLATGEVREFADTADIQDTEERIEISAPERMAFAPLKKGENAPEFDIPALGKGRIKLKDLRGKVVLLDFWSVGCPPCLEATIHMQKLYDKYGSKGFTVIGANLDPYPQMAKNFKKRARLTYPIGFATNKMIQDYGGLRTIPQSFMVDKDGKLFRHYDGWGKPYAIQMEKDIKHLLGIKE